MRQILGSRKYRETYAYGVGTLMVGIAAVVWVTACASSADKVPSSGTSPAATPPAAPPNVVGTWSGDYAFPLSNSDGSPGTIKSSEKLVIERQDGRLVWGFDEYVDDGQTIRIPVRGSFDAGNNLTIAEEGGFFRGSVTTDGALELSFVRTDDQFTAFYVTLKRD